MYPSFWEQYPSPEILSYLKSTIIFPLLSKIPYLSSFFASIAPGLFSKLDIVWYIGSVSLYPSKSINPNLSFSLYFNTSFSKSIKAVSDVLKIEISLYYVIICSFLEFNITKFSSSS